MHANKFCIQKFNETDLRFRQRQRLRQLFPLRSHHVVILLEGVFQFQQLRRTEGRSYPFRFSEGLQKEAGNVGTWNIILIKLLVCN